MTTDSAHPEEIRFAVVLNGGVSLAVWMGGVVLELDRLTRARGEDGDAAYRAVLDLVGGTARADVITGTSAGGINGAALALSQVNRAARLSALRGLWVEHGRIDQLLRQPFSGQPQSLLQGDEYFLPKLEEALSGLTADFEEVPADEAPIDLRITTTLLNGVPKVSYDDLGQQLPQTVHQGSFSFRRDPSSCGDERDDFVRDKQVKANLVERLALAARSTASFPFAFEPSYVPVAGDDESGMGKGASWYRDGRQRSRFAVDGGVLVNTPTKEALEAIDRMPAEARVRRVMLLVFPHAPGGSGEDVQDELGGGPTVAGLGGKLLGALYSQSGRTYVDRVEAHNRAAASRRSGRNAMLNQLYGQDRKSLVPQLYRLSRTLYGQYRDVRIRYAATQLAGRLFDAPEADARGMTFERVRAAAEAAQRAWPADQPLPYVPSAPPPQTVLGQEGCWPWGFTMAERLAAATLDLLKRLIWVVPDADPHAQELAALRKQLHKCRAAIRKQRRRLDEGVDPGPPNQRHWAGRLRDYHAALTVPGNEIGAAVREQVVEIGVILRRITEEVLPAVGPEHDDMSELAAWRALLTAPLTCTEQKHLRSGADFLLSRLLALEISATCVSEVAPTGLDQPVELMQVSLRAENPFARQSRTPDDKAAGASLGRFSGFLKRSWRVNDWIWGRLDAATTLSQVVLSPERLYRQCKIEDQAAGSVRECAQRKVDDLVRTLFGTEPERLSGLAAAATNDLVRIYTSKSPDDVPATAPALARLVAWGLHLRIVTEELGALRDAIEADTLDGANRRSAGALFVIQHRTLLDDLERQGGFDTTPEKVERAFAALDAFDQARIGREPLGEELAGDQMIRTAATAAAVAVSVLDSDRSGLGVAKPVTRTLRGASLLPYWAVNGLTRGNRIAQAGGLLAVVLGAALLMLSLFDLLPDGLLAPAAALGAGMVLTAFGYAALRSRTMLHGLVLLSPVIPLVTHAVTRVDPDDPEQKAGVVSLAGVAAVVVVLMVLGSIPVIRRTPFALLADVLPKLLGWLFAALFLALPAAQIGLLLADPAARAVEFVREHRTLSAVLVAVALAVVAIPTAHRQGRGLKRWQRTTTRWELTRTDHPAAATAGWAVAYGVVFLAAGTAGLALPWQGDPVLTAALITAWVFAAVLLLVTPWWVPRQARRRIERVLVDEADRIVYPGQVSAGFVDRLRHKGMTYSYLLKLDGTTLVPRRRARRLVRRIEARLAQRQA
ncbi:patatin-like protein [Lentzea sp. NPDC003310]|uniref:patatin-like protein n=1 Tax=Lentzea sp. NPDC003310 TaxID=3154447 RepID=UPI0033A1BCF7